MRITLLQDVILWNDKVANLERTAKHLKKLEGKTDLVVLPEMFTTGFTIERTDLAETMEGVTVMTLKKWAARYDFAIIGSFIAKESDKCYNRAFAVLPDGSFFYADKRHLFSPGREGELFSKGETKLIVPYKNFNICILVCYDLRFPVWSRNVDNEYDLLVYVANWPSSRIKAWDALLTARALENQAYVCGVNRIGTDGEGLQYCGNSRLIDYKGNDLLFLTDSVHYQIETVDIDKDRLQEFRQKFPVWKDADKFSIDY